MSNTCQPVSHADRQTIAFAELAAGTIVEVYFRARGAVAAEVAFDGPAGPAGTLSGAGADHFVRHRLTLSCPASRLSVDPATTELSIAYAYSPETVMARGVTILHSGAAPTPAALAGYHFRPPFGWMNDPNGFGRFDGVFHLSYQHYPHSFRWHAMHWGHAVSADLVRWRHLPILLDPSEETFELAKGHGGAFSGSAIAVAGEPGFRAFFTDHIDGREPEMEVQRSVRSRDGYSVDAARLVLAGRPAGLDLSLDNRDPYVFSGPDGKLHLLQGSRDSETGVVLHYVTDDPEGLSGWTFVDRLYRETEFTRTIAECPAMVPLDGPADDPETRWALVFGLLLSRDPATRRRHLTMAVVGRFDGRTLVPEFRQELDFATDAYGFQAFADADGPVAIAWLANWADVDKSVDLPTAMTLPRRLHLDGDRLLSPPVAAVETLRQTSLDAAAFTAGRPVAIDGSAEIEIDLVAAGACFSVEFAHPQLKLAVRSDARGLMVLFDDGGRPSPDYLVAGARVETLRLFVDRGSIEVFADGGRLVGTKRLPGTEPVTAVQFVGQSDDIRSARLWRLAL